MKIRDSIKSKIDKLDQQELRTVDLLINSLRKKNKIVRLKKGSDEKPYERVIKILGNSPLGYNDIDSLRQDRI